MEARVGDRERGVGERVWLVEHPPLYTAGTSARAEDLLVPDRFPVFATGPRRPVHLSRPRPARGLCHARPEPAPARPSPLRRRARGMDHPHARRLRRSRRAPGRPDRRLGRPSRQRGRRRGQDRRHRHPHPPLGHLPRHRAERRSRSSTHFSGIVPCGVRGHGVTSLADLGVPVSMAEVDAVLRREFEELFGGTARPDRYSVPSTLKLVRTGPA